jgi:uncharacterized repeat protein (TIGR01451 family)
VGSIENTASVASEVFDPASSGNSATSTTTVEPAADLALTKTDSPDPVLRGEQLTYTLTVQNAGPSDATGVQLTDYLPAGVTFASATASQGSCAEASGVVGCALGTLATGQDATVEIEVRPQSDGSITNTASVSSDVFELSPEDDVVSATTTVSPVSDLSVTKSDSPDPVPAGQLLTYALTVGNGGPSGAPAVLLTDNLPAGVTFESATASQGTCAEASGVVSCALGTIPNGQNATVEIQVRPQTEGAVTNTADVASDAFDPVSSDNSATAGTIVNPAADLSLTKTDSPDPVLVDQQLTYTLTVDNAGPSSATGVQITDNLPAGVAFESATPSQGTCAETDGTVTCALGMIANGQSATVEIRVRPQSGGTITNMADVTSDAFDPVSSDNSAGATTTVEPAADLSLTKTDSPDPVLLGELLTYTLSIDNAGPSDATGVQVADNLPAGVTFESATASQGTCAESAGEVTCALGTLASGESATVAIGVRAQSVGSVENTATVSSAVFDPSSSGNSATSTTTVEPAADLSITKTDSPDPVLLGELLTYTLTVANAGPSDATGVQVTDNLPAGVTFESATASQGSCSEASGTVTCALGTLASGESAGIEIQIRPQSEGTITNTAEVTSDAFDPVSSDNSSSAVTTVTPGADLSLTKTDSPDPVAVGEPLTYTLSAHNAGPSSATGVQVTDDLPAGVTFESTTPSQGACQEAGGTVTCALGTLASGESATVEIQVRPQSEGLLSNTATVSSDVFDPTSSNDSATAGTIVNPAADLSLTKSDAPDPVVAGELLTYTLTAANSGPSSATGVQVTDNLPAGVAFQSAASSQGTCSETGGTVTCVLGTIASGQSATVEIQVRPQGEGLLTNSANVVSDVFERNPQDNSAGTSTTVTPAADLSLTKTGSPDPVPAGQLLTYTLTARNAGPSDATGVQLTDDLPAGVAFESATPSRGTCAEASGTVTCALGTLASGQSATVEIEIRPQAEGSLTNDASVSSDVFDPSSADNSATATTTVGAAADLSLAKTDSPDPAQVGQLLTYTLTVENAGPSDATEVQLTDDLPAGVTFEMATPSQGTCAESAGTVTCALGTIASGESATVEVKVRPQSEGSLTNSASVSSDAFEPSPDDNSASVPTTVDGVADLSLTKTDAPDPVPAGGLLAYTLTARNAGPSSATGVQLTDDLPAGVTFESATPSQGTCTESAGTVACALGTLPSGANADVDVNVRPQSAGSLTNDASVSSDVFDPSARDNSAAATTTVLAGHVRPKGATPLRSPLVPAYRRCTAPNTSHGAPLDYGSCQPPAESSSQLTLGTPDANGAPAGGTGTFLLRTRIGNPSDVLISATLADVRCRPAVATCGSANSADGPDYTGELEVTYSLRLTDRFNNPTSTTAGTMVDASFPATIPCSATSILTIGATCTLNTTANAVMPGSVRTGDRAIWQIGNVQVFDGGPDGQAATADNALFQTQGLFVP